MIPVYDKEQWWAICLEAKPDLTRQEFEARWAHMCHIADFFNLWRKV